MQCRLRNAAFKGCPQEDCYRVLSNVFWYFPNASAMLSREFLVEFQGARARTNGSLARRAVDLYKHAGIARDNHCASRGALDG